MVKQPNHYPSPFSRRDYIVPEVTDILKQWGISHNDKKTRDLIQKGKLIARSAGQDPKDKRAGYLIRESDVYKLILEEIPIYKEIIEPKIKKADKKPSEGTGRSEDGK